MDNVTNRAKGLRNAMLIYVYFLLGFLVLLAIPTSVFPKDISCSQNTAAFSRSAKKSALSVKESPHEGISKDQDICPLVKNLKKKVWEVYRKNDYKPIFFSNGMLNRKGQELITRLRSLINDGIDISPYNLELLQDKMKEISNLNTLLSSLLNRKLFLLTRNRWKIMPAIYFRPSLGEDQQNVSINSWDLSNLWANLGSSYKLVFKRMMLASELLYKINREAGILDFILTEDIYRLSSDMGLDDCTVVSQVLYKENSLTSFLKALEPPSPHYAPLRNMLSCYLKKNGSFYEEYSLPSKTLRKGDKGPEVFKVKKILEREGFYRGDIDEYFDPNLEKSVKSFQSAFGLKVDGIVGINTKKCLVLPRADKIKMVRVSMSILREKSLRRASTYILVNIPQFLLEVYHRGKLISCHKVIVGRAKGEMKRKGNHWVSKNQTPVLESQIKRVIFKPRWFVNSRIRKELEKESEDDPEYYNRMGFVFVPSRSPGKLPRLYQKPGPKNALGLVKFEFPNRYEIYLHDTPSKELFSKNRRDFSHGCIRVENALALAKEILTIDQNPSIKHISRYLAKSTPTYVKLKNAIPIFIKYIPVSTDEYGNVRFCQDIYGRLKLN